MFKNYTLNFKIGGCEMKDKLILAVCFLIDMDINEGQFDNIETHNYWIKKIVEGSFEHKKHILHELNIIVSDSISYDETDSEKAKKLIELLHS